MGIPDITPDLSVGSDGIEQAIEIGIQIENEGRKFYLDKANEIQIPFVRHHLNKLAEEEVEHSKVLTELKNSLIERGEWISIKEEEKAGEKTKELALFGAEKGPKIENASSVLEVLDQALKLEERTMAFYSKLASEIQNDKGKQFFTKLADWEGTHIEMINGMRELVLGMAGTIA